MSGLSGPIDDGTTSLNLLNGLRTTDGKNGRLGKAQNALALAGAGMVLYNQVKSRIEHEREQRTYRVSLAQTDDVYPAVQRELLEKMPDAKQRSLRVFTASGRERDERNVWQAYDREGAETIDIDGHRVRVSLEADDDIDQSAASMQMLLKPKYLIFRTSSSDGQRAVLGWLDRIAQEYEQLRTKTGTMFYTATKWGDWRRRPELMKRPVESVILKPGQRERLLDDVGAFLSQEDRYLSFGQPWHRGYLLHGPPGCGKTSVAQAIASHHALSLYYVSLSAVESDGDLAELFSGVSARSVLLLEDVDVLHAATHRDDDTKGITLTGLLNVLDGVATPHGLVTVMTTNHLDRLDPALRRPGRTDLVEFVDELSLHQLGMLLDFLVPGFRQLPNPHTDWYAGYCLPYTTSNGDRVQLLCEDPVHDESIGVTPAQVTEILKTTYDDGPEAMVDAVYELIDDGRSRDRVGV